MIETLGASPKAWFQQSSTVGSMNQVTRVGGQPCRRGADEILINWDFVRMKVLRRMLRVKLRDDQMAGGCWLWKYLEVNCGNQTWLWEISLTDPGCRSGFALGCRVGTGSGGCWSYGYNACAQCGTQSFSSDMDCLWTMPRDVGKTWKNWAAGAAFMKLAMMVPPPPSLPPAAPPLSAATALATPQQFSLLETLQQVEQIVGPEDLGAEHQHLMLWFVNSIVYQILSMIF